MEFKTEVNNWLEDKKDHPLKATFQVIAALVGIFGIVSFCTDKLGWQLGIWSLLMSAVALVVIQNYFMRLRHEAEIREKNEEIEKRKKRINNNRKFEEGLVRCLDNATKQLNPRTVLHRSDISWDVEENGNLKYTEVFELSNGGEGNPLIHWLRWGFSVDNINPGINSIEDIKHKAKCLEPEGLLVVVHMKKVSDRRIEQYFIFPEAVGHEYRKISYSFIWPGFFKHLYETGEDAMVFEYEHDSPRILENTSMTVRFPPNAIGNRCTATRNNSLGDFPKITEEQRHLERRNYVYWEIPHPRQDKLYSLTITLAEGDY